jgi:enoyl-CoA hydratase
MPAFEVEVTAGVAVLSFTRPPNNWMDLASITELVGLLEGLASGPDDVTVVMLTGGVDGYFVAHADLDDLVARAQGEQPSGDPEAFAKATALLESMPQPTVAAIDGQAWGGGCELALACTLRVGSERAHLALPEVSVGVIPGAGGTQRLPRIVAPAVAAEIILSGRIVKAQDALRIGLLNDVLPTEGFRDHALSWCGRITRHSRAAVLAAKRATVDGARLPLAEGLRLERSLFDRLNESPAAQERIARMARPPE